MVTDVVFEVAKWLNDPEIKKALSTDTYAKLFGKLYGLDFESDTFSKDLFNFPGEVSRQERMYLYHFFAAIWSGQKDVIEIGPFLGATTRSIAFGMLENKNRNPKATLHTHDRFVAYYDRERLLELLRPLIDAGVFAGEAQRKLEGLAEMPDFREIFDEIHSDTPYSSILSAHKSVLPGAREELATTDHLFRSDASNSYDIVFVDGCKSWYATKYFAQEVCKNVEAGGYFIYQDFGWRSCFWLPVFWAQLSDYFEVISFVENTYVFRLLKNLDAQTIEQRFPDQPSGFGRENFNIIFPKIILHAAEIGDVRGIAYATMQHASALAYVGAKDEARAVLENLERQPISHHYLHQISQAKISPTYFPDGTKILL
jgi:hypothetical protein